MTYHRHYAFIAHSYHPIPYVEWFFSTQNYFIHSSLVQLGLKVLNTWLWIQPKIIPNAFTHTTFDNFISALVPSFNSRHVYALLCSFMVVTLTLFETLLVIVDCQKWRILPHNAVMNYSCAFKTIKLKCTWFDAVHSLRCKMNSFLGGFLHVIIYERTPNHAWNSNLNNAIRHGTHCITFDHFSQLIITFTMKSKKTNSEASCRARVLSFV